MLEYANTLIQSCQAWQKEYVTGRFPMRIKLILITPTMR